MKRDLTLEEIKLLVYDARMKPNATISELLEPLQENPSRANFLDDGTTKQFWTLDEAIRGVWNINELAWLSKCNAWLIYKPIALGHVEILKNRFKLQGIVTRAELNTEIEKIKEYLEIE